MIYAKLGLALLIMLGGTGIYFAIKENGRLSAELEQAVQVNEEITSALLDFQIRRQKDEAELLKRDEYRKQQQKAIGDLKRKLRNVTNIDISQTEKECVLSDVPLPIVEFLRIQPKDNT